jgi:hypothetical protein
MLDKFTIGFLNTAARIFGGLCFPAAVVFIFSAVTGADTILNSVVGISLAALGIALLRIKPVTKEQLDRFRSTRN